MDLEDAGKSLAESMEPSLEAYLAPSYNHSVSSPTTLPSKYCTGISPAAQLEKVCRGHLTTVCALNSITILLTYQAMCWWSSGLRCCPGVVCYVSLTGQIRITADYILCVSISAALSLGCGKTSVVVEKRYLWLSLSNISERD